LKKLIIYLVTTVLILSIIATVGVIFYQNHPQDPTPQLQSLVDSKWAAYTANYTGLKGGLSMKILTPKGDYFVSTMLGDNATDGIHFRTASVTKTFTAAAIMMLYQEGKLDIDANITHNIPGTNIPYIPDTANYAIPYKNDITIRQLLGHRAGVFDVDNTAIPENCSQTYAGQMYVPWIEKTDPYHQFNFDELVGVVAANNLSYFKPGANYHYSDTGYSMLGKIVERVSNQTYDDYVYQHLVVPNGLTQTTLVSAATDTKLPPPFETGYSYIRGVCYETTEDNMSPHVSEGNIITTPLDLARWGKLLYSGQAGINSTLVAMMMDVIPFDDQGHYYGLGTQYTEGLGYGHNGGNMGYITIMRTDPQKQFTVVISVSCANFDEMVNELNFMFDLGRSAKQLTGYS
jgi:D-alanyl-D-alanine carboxypeptidase